MFTIPNRDGPDSPWPIFERVLVSHPELSDLSDLLGMDCTIAFMFRAGEWTRGPKEVLGAAFLPAVQGELRPLFNQLLEDCLGFFPDWLVVLNLEWWTQASPREREVLLFHECLHCGQALDKHGTPRFSRTTGQPVVCLKPHDIEEFKAVVGRYGPWKSDLREFLESASRWNGGASDGEAY